MPIAEVSACLTRCYLPVTSDPSLQGLYLLTWITPWPVTVQRPAMSQEVIAAGVYQLSYHCKKKLL